MSCLAFFAGRSPIHRLDPRVRLLSAATLAITVALSARFAAMGWALGLAAALAAAARLDFRPLFRRWFHINAFMLFLWLVLPWSVPGTAVGMVGGCALTEEGLRLALAITLKGNAIMLLFTALVATIDPQRLGYALHRLGLPDKLVHLLMLTIRYADVIHDEHVRLRRAIRARAFRPCFSFHTLRTFGYLVGLLLIRGVERSEQVLAAMKCRGFDGRFRSMEAWALRRADMLFACGALFHVGAWIWMERI